MIAEMPGDIFRTGQILNNTYEVLGVLGRGGTGEVYLARNQVVERDVAIKALNLQFSGNAEYLELMKREEEMRDIVHNAVVRYSECSKSDQGHVFLVMEYVDGISLSDAMAERRLSTKELMIIAHRVLEGLVAVHAHGIVHRDLSPDNIILRDGQAERATIIDFGIAKDTAAGARTIVGNDFAGKYEYAAPEQLEGQAEYRTDLYSLGASLLAAHQRDVPFLGATPGEIIRRKQEPLDTTGVEAPLNSVISMLAAPALNDRPRDAAAALEKVAGYLAQHSNASPPKDKHDKPRRKSAALKWLLAPGVAAVAAALWFGVLADDPLPVAVPFAVSASFDRAGQAAMTAHAPDETSADFLRDAFANSTGTAPLPGSITLAQGVPSAVWPTQVAGLLDLLTVLENWTLDVADQSATIDGLASNLDTRIASQTAIESWSAQTGFEMQLNLIAGPEFLPKRDVLAAIEPFQTCGKLDVVGAEENGAFPLFDTLRLRGDLADASDTAALQAALMPLVGDRNIKMETVTLNSDLCAIRKVLPAKENSNLTIWMGDGETGEISLTGAFKTGQNPIVEVHLPDAQPDTSLWVMVVDNTGKVFHVLPHINRTEHEVGKLGEVSGGVRQVRVLYSVEEFKQNNDLLAFQITEGDYGKSEVIAILSKAKLFDMRRPRDESVSSFAQALEETLAGRMDQIIAVSSRIIEARP